MEWISIKDMMPDFDKMVLISTIGDKTQNDPIRLTPHIAAIVSQNSKGYIWMTDAGDSPIGEVTHWMPLPQNPKP